MATPEQTRALLAVPCPHCGAGQHTPCRVRVYRRGGMAMLPITTLDGGSHDARWMAALGVPAPVRADVLAERHPRVAEGARTPRGSVAVLDPPRPQEAPDERPW